MLGKLDDWLTYIILLLWRQRYRHKLKAILVNIVIKLSYRAWSHVKKRKEGGRRRGKKGKLLIIFFHPKKKLHAVISTHRSLKLWNSIKGNQQQSIAYRIIMLLIGGFKTISCHHTASPGYLERWGVTTRCFLASQDSYVTFLYSKTDICY